MNRPHRRTVYPALFLLLAIVALTITSTTTAQSVTPNLIVGIVDAHTDPEAALNSGAGWELVHFRWDLLQPSGPSDWQTDGPISDEWLSTARSQGREVVGVLVGTPAWATDGDPFTGVPRGLNLPNNDPGNVWAAFVRQVVNYYSTRGVNHWVIWEDIDAPPGQPTYTWNGTDGQYYQMVKVAYQVAKETNPSAEIHLAGFGAYDPTWLNGFLDIVVNDPTAAANDFYFDVATVHIYYSSENVHTQSLNPFYLMNAKGMPLKRVWINQTNARPAVDPTAYGGESDFNNYANVTLDQQAAFIIQAYALGLAAGVERIGTYRLVDDLVEDNGEAWGLVRADGSERPAYTAQQIVAREFNDPIYRRRVDEQSFPLMDYVRLTFATRVTHIFWARTEQNATLIIPARGSQAILIDMYDNQWTVEPENGEYRIATEGADCNEPTAPAGCLIGGAPWILIELDVPDPVNSEAPVVRVETGGTPLIPTPGQELTATALAQPTATPTAIPPTSTPESTASPTIGTIPTDVPTVVSATPLPTNEVAEAPPPTDVLSAPTLAPTGPRPGAPIGFMAVLPYLMMVLGVVVVAGGVVFFLGVWPFDRASLDETYEEIYDDQDWDEDETVYDDDATEYDDLDEGE